MLKCVNHCLWLHASIWQTSEAGQFFFVGTVMCIVGYLIVSLASTHQMLAAFLSRAHPKHLQTLTKSAPRLRTTADQWFSTGPMSNCLVLPDQWLLMWKTLCTLYVECCVCSISQVVMCMQVICSNSRNLSWMLTWYFFNKRQVMPLMLLCGLHFDEQGSIRSEKIYGLKEWVIKR